MKDKMTWERSGVVCDENVAPTQKLIHFSSFVL